MRASISPGGRRPGTVLLAATVAVLLSCSDSPSPTEPSTASDGATLTGVVRDASGVPVAFASVVCQGRFTLTRPDSDSAPGSFSLEKLMTGPSSVSIQQAGEKDATTFPVTLRSGRNTVDLSVARFRGEPATVSGVVRFAGTRPATPVTVWCQDRSADVGPDGSYVLSGLVSGYWGVEVTWAPYNEHGKEVTLAPGANVVDFEL